MINSLVEPRVRAWATFLFVIVGVSIGHANSTSWQLLPPADGSWYLGGNWSAGVPVTADDAFISNGGTALVSTAGSIAKALNFYIGQSAADSGRLNLGAGTLSIGSLEVIGQSGAGTFLQSGGVHLASAALTVGANAGSAGTYLLSGGSLTVGTHFPTDTETIGGAGSAYFIQTGGTQYVQSRIFLGAQSGGAGTFSIANASATWGGASLGGTETAAGGAGTVNVLAGGSLRLGGIKAYAGSSFSLNGGTLSTASIDFASNTFHWNTGTLNLRSDLAVQSGQPFGSSPRISIGQSLVIGEGAGSSNHAVIGATAPGTLTIAGGVFATYSSLAVAASSNGTIQQDSGTVEIRDGAMSLGSVAGTVGQYTLNNGEVYVNQSLHLGLSGRGTFTQFDGHVAIGTTIYFGEGFDGPTGRGLYMLNGGSVSAQSIFVGGSESGPSGTGVITVNGGSLTTTGSISILTGNGRRIDLQGGAISATGGIKNAGRFTYSAGSLNAAIDNTGSFILSGAGTRRVNGLVVNEAGGKVIVQSTSVEYTGSFTSSGSYSSEAAINNFQDFTMTSTGSFAAASGDQVIVRGGWKGQGNLQASQFRTDYAELHFSDLALPGARATPAAAHSMVIAGQDLGATYNGYNNNSAWGVLTLDPQSDLNLVDGSSLPGTRAVYVRSINLLGGLQQIGDITGNGLNIYYDAEVAGNDYLNGQTYSLLGGGVLTPAPEPSTVALISALLVLFARRRSHTTDPII